MRKTFKYIVLAALLAGAVSCGKDLPREIPGSVGCDVMTLNVSAEESDEGETKSSIISNQNSIKDLNIWHYGSNGTLIASYYRNDFSSGANVSVQVNGDFAGGDCFLVIANLGRQVVPESTSVSAQVTVPMSYIHGNGNSQDVVGMAYQPITYSDANRRWEWNYTLTRVMSCVALTCGLDDSDPNSIFCSGAEPRFGSTALVKSARFVDVPQAFVFTPNDPASCRTYADAGVTGGDGFDALSTADLAAMNVPVNSGQKSGTAYLYTMPNYVQSNGGTKLETVFHLSEGNYEYVREGLTFGNIVTSVTDATEGDVYCCSPLYSGSLDAGTYCGLLGGRQHNLTLTLTGEVYCEYSYRGTKVDTRFVPVEPVGVGQDGVIWFLQKQSADNLGQFTLNGVPFTLDELYDGPITDGVISINGAVSSYQTVDGASRKFYESLNFYASNTGTSVITYTYKGASSTVRIAVNTPTDINVGGDDNGGGGNNNY